MRKILSFLFLISFASAFFAEDSDSWTEKDLESYLSSVYVWFFYDYNPSDMESSLNILDGVNSFYKDHGFSTGTSEKGEASNGKWKTLSPNTVEIAYDDGSFQKMLISNIDETSFVYEELSGINKGRKYYSTTKGNNDLYAYSVGDEVKARIPLFSKLDLKKIKETGSEAELYDIFDKPVDMYVKTDDGSKLNCRESPVDGKITGQFVNYAYVRAVRKTKKSYTIGGLTDYWYYVRKHYGHINDDESTAEFGYVFGAYLKKY